MGITVIILDKFGF